MPDQTKRQLVSEALGRALAAVEGVGDVAAEVSSNTLPIQRARGAGGAFVETIIGSDGSRTGDDATDSLSGPSDRTFTFGLIVHLPPGQLIPPNATSNGEPEDAVAYANRLLGRIEAEVLGRMFGASVGAGAVPADDGPEGLATVALDVNYLGGGGIDTHELH